MKWSILYLQAYNIFSLTNLHEQKSQDGKSIEYFSIARRPRGPKHTTNYVAKYNIYTNNYMLGDQRYDTYEDMIDAAWKL